MADVKDLVGTGSAATFVQIVGNHAGSQPSDARIPGFAIGSRLLGFFVLDRNAGTPQAVDHARASMGLEAAYDMRIFEPDREWHWWWDQHRREGRWAALDDGIAADRGWSRLCGSTQDADSRLLRGSVVQRGTGWSQLHDGHSRPMWVPVGSPHDHRHVRIGAVEYTCVDDPRGRLTGGQHGNVGVVAERLTTLKAVE